MKCSNGAYYKARINGWLDDYDWFEVLWENKWNKETCYEEAKRYKTRNEFRKGNVSAYLMALKNGWLDDYVWFKVLRKKWNYNTCYEEAMKYKTRSEFQKGSVGAYNAALKNGWLVDYTWFKKVNGFINKTNVRYS